MDKISTPSAIYFDHDGTLVDSEKVHFSIWQGVVEDYGCELTESFYNENLVGVPAKQNARDIAAYFNLEVPAQALEQEKNTRLNALLSKQSLPLMPDAIAVLEKCAEMGIAMAIVTGATRYTVEQTIAFNGLEKYFQFAITADDVKHGKPAPDVYAKAVKKMGIPAALGCAVEDTQAGLTAAVAAGLACDIVPTPLSAGQDFAAARATYQSLSAWAKATLNN